METALFPLPHQHDDLFRYLISTMTFSVALSVGPRAHDTTVLGIEEDGDTGIHVVQCNILGSMNLLHRTIFLSNIKVNV